MLVRICAQECQKNQDVSCAYRTASRPTVPALCLRDNVIGVVKAYDLQ